MWKDIVGYEGYYQINENGEVKSMERIIIGRWGETLRKEKILNPITSGKRYPMFGLSKDGKKKYYNQHQLLAQAFISNPYNKKCVNHIDNNGFNNDLSNLEWATYSENTIHAWENGYNENVRKAAKERMKKTYAGWNKGMKLSEWTDKIIKNEKSGRFESNKDR
jgi:hypothetical protein